MSVTPASGELFIHSAPPVTLHMESSNTQSLSWVEYKEAEVGRGLVDTKTQSEKERLNGI